MKEEEVRVFMQSPHVMVGTDSHLRELNDGHCHPRNYGTYPRILGRYVREDNVLTLPQAIHKMTQMPATKYGIKERAHVSLRIYNAAGQLVRTLVDEVLAPDQVTPVEWDGSNNAGQAVSSGVYFYRLVTKNFSQTKKMVLLK